VKKINKKMEDIIKYLSEFNQYRNLFIETNESSNNQLNIKIFKSFRKNRLSLHSEESLNIMKTLESVINNLKKKNLIEIKSLKFNPEKIDINLLITTKYMIKESKHQKINYKTKNIDGFTIYYGKDAIANDYITFEIALDNDIWLHSYQTPGSHVLIKVNDIIPSESVIKAAAEIAAKNSKSKDTETKVVYCKKKFVKKENGMNIGQVKVDYKNSNFILV